MSAVWVERPVPPAAGSLAAAGYDPSLAALLAQRGIETAVDASTHLSPTLAQLHAAESLTGLPAAVERLATALREATPVVVVGDYDVDGLSATALLVASFRAVGLRTEAILPSRRAGGYGLQPDHVERAVAGGAGLLVTADCGTQAHPALAVASRHALPVIVTDHHLTGTTAPDVAAFVNPHQPGCRYPFRELSGAGVAFKLAVALFHRLDREPPWESLLRMACLGTIADAVPLLGENRVLAQLGLAALPATRSPGLRALFESAQIGNRISATDVAFRLGPRLNAPGRIADPDPALELLLTRDPGRARALAAELERANRTRQQLEQRVLDDCAERLARGEGDAPIFVAWSTEWHRGVVGIAAGRLSRQLQRPVVLFACDADGQATGSGRGVEAVDLHAFFAPFTSQLVRFGGHAAAIGMTAESARLPELRERWVDAARAVDWSDSGSRPVAYDLELTARDASLDFATRLEELEPFGTASPEPLFRLGPLRLGAEPRRFGSGHVGLRAIDARGDACEIVAWRWPEREEPWRAPFEILAALEVDRWASPARPRLRLQAARPAAGSAP